MNLRVTIALIILLTSACEPEDLPRKAKIATVDVSEVNDTSATVTGQLKDYGKGIQDHGFCWSANTDKPTLSNNKVSRGDLSSEARFSSSLRGLSPNESYSVRAFAESEDQVVYGRTLTLSTLAWSKKSDFSGAIRSSAVGFSINGKGYFGTGVDSNGTPSKGFWQYNPITDSWSQKADFDGGARKSAVGCSAGGYGYIGLGREEFTWKNDFWQYDPNSNTWNEVARFPGVARQSAVCFSINDKVYVGTGYDGSKVYDDLWAFNPRNNSWQKKAPFPGAKRHKAVAFSAGKKGYVGLGADKPTNETLYKDFYAYNAATNTWEIIDDFKGGSRINAVSFSIGRNGYVGFGRSKYPKKDFYQFHSASAEWIKIKNGKVKKRHNPTGFALDNKAYLGIGKAGSVLKDFWQYKSE